MSICLCNFSADGELERLAQKKASVEPAQPDPTTFTADAEQIRAVLGERLDEMPRPIEVLVGNSRRRRASSDVSCHVWRGPLPKNSVYQVEEGIYVTSPELTLLHQSTQLHQASLCMMLGRYLGTWSPTPKGKMGQEERAPLTSFDRMHDFVSSLGQTRGANTLRFAMAHTCEGAASEPETALQLALNLPPELYGLALPQPIMNYEVSLSPAARLLYPHDTIRIDLCWRNHQFGLEYQGKWHGSQLGEDYARWFAARREQYELWFLANEQLSDAAQMRHIGREVAKRLGMDVDLHLWPTVDELQDLLDTLTGRKHPNPVKYDDLRKRQAAIRSLARKGGVVL